MQQGDYSSIPPYYQQPQYPQTQNLAPPSYASAPPFTPTNSYPSSDYSPYPSPYPTTPDPLPTAPSFAQPPPPPQQQQQAQPTSPFPPFESHAPYQPHQHQAQSQYYPPYDPPQPANYTVTTPPPQPPHSTLYSSPSQFNQLPSAAAPPPPFYDNPYDQTGVGGHNSASWGRSDSGSDYYGLRAESGGRNGYGIGNDGGAGVYQYQGSKVEPYGARGTAPKSSTWSGFDDFGRPIGYSDRDKEKGQLSNSGSKLVRAVPKADVQQDVKSGVQKFRVKVLAESGSQSNMDVLCQVGLDGIRMLDPSTSRMLRIYPLDTITRCEVMNSSTFVFWSKSSVDIEPRRIRLQSNSYTTNTILDTVTAATVQFKEMGGTSRPSESPGTVEQPAEKKKAFADWVNLIKPVNEEKDHWVPDEAVTKCTACGTDFSAFVRKHHCRNCGDIFCDKCTHGRIALTAEDNAPVVRVCDRCMAEVSHRISNAKEAASKSTVLRSHEDLAKKLQEEMERNRKASSGSRSDGSGRRMKEVACPTCTVHLQVQVPSSGSETIECGVCQHPFLVSAH